MTTRQIKQRLVLATAALLLASAGALAWALLVPVEVTGSVGSLSDGRVASSDDSEPGADKPPPLDKLRVLGRIDLRRPLKDPPPPPPPPPVPLRAKLLGTIYEPKQPDNSMAMFKLADGSEQWVTAGQSFSDPVGQVKVVKIGDQTVTLFYKDQESELTVGSQ